MRSLKMLVSWGLWSLVIFWTFGMYGTWRNANEFDSQLKNCGICLVDDESRLRSLVAQPPVNLLEAPLFFYTTDAIGFYFNRDRFHSRLIDYAAKSYSEQKDLTIAELILREGFGQPYSSMELGRGVRLFTFELVDMKSSWPRRYFRNRVTFVEREGLVQSVTFLDCKDADGFHCW